MKKRKKVRVDADYVQTMNMTLLAGRNFENGVPNHDEVLINEKAARLLGFMSAGHSHIVDPFILAVEKSKKYRYSGIVPFTCC